MTHATPLMAVKQKLNNLGVKVKNEYSNINIVSAELKASDVLALSLEC